MASVMARLTDVPRAIHPTSASVPIRQVLPSLASLTGSTAGVADASGLRRGPGSGAGRGSSPATSPAYILPAPAVRAPPALHPHPRHSADPTAVPPRTCPV